MQKRKILKFPFCGYFSMKFIFASTSVNIYIYKRWNKMYIKVNPIHHFILKANCLHNVSYYHVIKSCIYKQKQRYKHRKENAFWSKSINSVIRWIPIPVYYLLTAYQVIIRAIHVICYKNFYVSRPSDFSPSQ